jgi:hypothetical protein
LNGRALKRGGKLPRENPAQSINGGPEKNPLRLPGGAEYKSALFEMKNASCF